MSNNPSNTQQATRGGRGRGGRASAPTGTRDHRPGVLATSGRQDLVVRASPGVPGGAVVVCVGGSTGVTSITYHHPIGATSLQSDEWVATPSEEVARLLQRSKDPRGDSVASGYETHRLEAAVSATPALLIKKGAKYYLPGEQNIPRVEVINVATTAAKAKLQAGRNPTKEQIGAEIPGTLRTQEDSLRNFLDNQEVKDAARAANPIAVYETKGGPLADQPQVGIVPLKGKTSQEVTDYLVRRLLTFQ